MSLYNGLISHEVEQSYYQLVRHLVLVLEKRVLRFYQGRPCNEHKFVSILSRLRGKIARIEKSKYSEPKFADSLKDLLEELRPQCRNEFPRGGTASEISVNMNRSDISFDLSQEGMPRASKISVAQERVEENRVSIRKNYRSFESIKSTPVIKEDEEWHYPSNSNRTSRLRSSQFKPVRLRLQPPKLGDYLERLKKESRLVEVVGRKREGREESGEPYLGQRRKKNKRVVRTIENQW